MHRIHQQLNDSIDPTEYHNYSGRTIYSILAELERKNEMTVFWDTFDPNTLYPDMERKMLIDLLDYIWLAKKLSEQNKMGITEYAYANACYSLDLTYFESLALKDAIQLLEATNGR